MEGFEGLVVWQECRLFRNEIANMVKSFPLDEKYKLVDQILRSSRSITANIAEGHGRYHYQENIQFCRVSRGSLSESFDHLICANDCNYISQEVLNNFRLKYNHCLKLINGYILYLQKRKNED